jgi:hypothetical protein
MSASEQAATMAQKETSTPTIFDIACRCSQLFTAYQANRYAPHGDNVDELQSRFGLWVSYTGAFADHGASLDDRLIFHGDVKRLIIKLLQMIERNIQSGEHINLRSIS